MTDTNNGNPNVVTNLSYNAASQLLTMNVAAVCGRFNETRTYDAATLSLQPAANWPKPSHNSQSNRCEFPMEDHQALANSFFSRESS